MKIVILGAGYAGVFTAALVYDNNRVSEISTPLNFLSYATTMTISGSKNVL